MHLLLTSALLALQSALPAAIHSHPASYAGVWAVAAEESGGVSTADDKINTLALTMSPTFLTLQKDGRYLRKHVNFAAAETEEGAFSVVRAFGGWAEVDVTATLRIRGDGRPQDIKFAAKEVWRLTAAGTLQRCYPADSAKGRPSGFKTAQGDGLVVVTYARVKAPDGPGAVAVGLAPGQVKGDAGISVLAGEWKIDYTHGAVRTYVVETDGKVTGTADEEKLKGQITRENGVLLLVMGDDGKLERLTLGVDGRLFVEHYGTKADYPEQKASHIGIGTRQK